MDIAPSGVLTIYKYPAVFTNGGARRITSAGRLPKDADLPSKPLPYAIGSLISHAASRYAIDTNLLLGLAWRESRFNQSANSSKGAIGVMQLMPATARDLGVDRYDPSQNILGGAAYLRQMLDRYRGDQSLALAAYNAGPGAVDRYRGIPPYPETRRYVSAIVGLAGLTASLHPAFVISVDP